VRGLGPASLGALLVLAAGCDVDPFCIDCADGDGGSTDGGVREGGRIDAPPRLPDAGEGDSGLHDGCVPGAPELCNDFDDDCDGEVDEGVDTSSDPSNCGGCGNACEPAHAFGTCTDGVCGLGPCDVGWHDLDGDEDNGCEYRCLPSGDDDSVCDLRDNDCDGDVDEDVDLMTDTMNCGMCGRTCRIAHATAVCTDGMCAVDSCDLYFHDLDGDPGNGCEYGCVPESPAVESCNGRDDDCDGSVDEGDPGGGARCGTGTGECVRGTEACMGGVIECVGGTGPVAETCNTRDDDCDGSVDEETDFMRDPRNCGACGVTCGLPHAITACDMGSCDFVACDPGYHDVDPSMPGCEYMCSISGGEVCNGADDDCDGDTDEGLTPPTRFCNANGVCSGTDAACSGAMGWTCTYTDPRYQPSETLCDGADNDCDGDTDEPFPMLGSSCENGLGACRRTGSYVCASDGLSAVCDAAMAGTPETESCDGTDEDCDGVVDEGIPLSSIPTVQMSLPTGGTVDIFRYEASRPNATAMSAGTIETAACSRSDRLPWTNVTWMDARDACCALNPGGTCPASATSDGWRLCDEEDWEMACQSSSGSCDWSYRTSCSTSSPTTCNGAEHDCDPGTAGDQDCLYTTGSSTFPDCRSRWAGAGAVYDLSGNVKEWTDTEVVPGVYRIRGGSYNNLEAGRTCTFDFTVGDASFAFPNTGFRCCYYDFP